MSFTAKYYQFKKDTNSTKRPPENTVTWTSTLEIIEPCSLMYPRIVVRRSNAPYPEEPGDYTKDLYNYCYIEEFSRYYWIDNWTYDNGLWIASLTCDVLATYRPQIGAESMYILRASAASDGYVRDCYYPMTGETSASGQIIEVDDIGFNSGVYIVNLVGSTTAGTTLFQLTPSEFNGFVRSLNAEIASAAGLIGSDVAQAVMNTLYQPMDYIRSVLWFPFSLSSFGSTVERMYVGKWDSGYSRPCLNAAAGLVRSYQITIPKHPQASRGKFLNMAPYSEYWISYQPFGVIPLDATRLVDESKITINIYADGVTGLGIMEVGGTNTGVLASVTAQFGVPVPMSGAGSSLGAVASAIGNIGAAVGGALTGNLPVMAAATAAGIGDAADCIRGTVSTMGNAGSVAAYQTGKTFGAIFHKITAENNAKNGRPYMKTATPASLGGFMIAQRGDVPIYGTREEADAIRSILESGFYYE